VVKRENHLGVCFNECVGREHRTAVEGKRVGGSETGGFCMYYYIV